MIYSLKHLSYNFSFAGHHFSGFGDWYIRPTNEFVVLLYRNLKKKKKCIYRPYLSSDFHAFLIESVISVPLALRFLAASLKFVSFKRV